MKFQYAVSPSVLDSRGRMVRRPILILELKTTDGRIGDVPAMIDSGADRTQVNFEYAKMTGIELGQRRDSIGIGDGRVEGYSGKFSFSIKNTDIQMDISATYLKSPNVVILLGREDFFDSFRIVFEQYQDSFELIRKK
jgi:hypothetical protein